MEQSCYHSYMDIFTQPLSGCAGCICLGLIQLGSWTTATCGRYSTSGFGLYG